MEKQILELKVNTLEAIKAAKNVSELEALRIKYLGRKGEVNSLLKEIAEIPTQEKAKLGKLANEVKSEIQKALKEKLQFLESTKLKNLDKEWLDVTIPGKKPPQGHLHPQTQVLRDIIKVFKQIGYQVAEGPEIETDRYNFTILNIPKDHPARDMFMTLYLDTKGTSLRPGEVILRSQTSAMQGRIMEKIQPPIRVIVPGKCFRYEQVDASHGFEFWQVEGFAVDKGIKLTDLFGTISYVLKQIMGEKTKLKFACTNFPFVEPGVDTYIECTVCQGKGCSFCKNVGWSEIMPAGMIHPFVLKSCGIDSKKYTGFAFAIGLSRVINLRYKMNDLRLLTTPDLRILNQF